MYLGYRSFMQAKKLSVVQYSPNNILYHSALFNYGFITDLLNPFITIFYFSLYYSIGLQDSSILVMLFCGILCALIVLLWFTAITFIFSNKRFTNFYLKRSIVIERIAATMLVYYGLCLLY
jgi:threonine/homoserine/homoserine lactone efflux protein